MKTSIFPQVNMLLVSKNSRKQREVMNVVIPKIGLSIIDYGRIGEIDSFYLLCQNQRDYYRDTYNKLRKISYFENYRQKEDSPLGPTTRYFKQPHAYAIEKNVPFLMPLQMGESVAKQIPEPIVLRGDFELGPSFSFKH